MYHSDGDCAAYIGTFLDALSLSRLEGTGRVFHRGGMDSIVQRAAFAQLHSKKYFYALRHAAGSYMAYEKAFKYVTERRAAIEKRRVERAEQMKARKAAADAKAANSTAAAQQRENAAAAAAASAAAAAAAAAVAVAPT